MKKIFLLFILMALFSCAFATATLEVNSINYNLYSNSLSRITFNLENTGDETATIVYNNLTGFENYIIHSYPETITVGDTQAVVFYTNVPCEIKGAPISFFANFTYSDSLSTYVLDSEVQNGVVETSVNVSVISPDDINTIQAIEMDESFKLSYLLSNNGFDSLTINLSVVQPDSVYSRILSSTGEYSSNDIDNELFTFQPSESYLFSHTLIPVVSGVAGDYIVSITDSECSYNSEILRVNYQTITSTPGPGFDLIVADEGNIFIIFIIIISVIYYQSKS